MKDIRRPSHNSRYNSRLSEPAPVVSAREDDFREMKLLKAKEKSAAQRGDTENELDYDDYRDLELDEKLNSFESRIDHVSANHSRIKHTQKLNKQKKVFVVFFFLVAIFAVAYVLYSYVFNSAVITITPKILKREISGSYTLILNPENKTYENVILERVVSRQPERGEKKKVTAKAGGNITIYNSYSESSQKLIKNTRFESESGKIFRIGETVTVPGKIGSTPGSVEVKVTADSIGESYNIEKSKFTIPGFKNSTRYADFYAMSQVSMTGGADSEKQTVNAELLSISKGEMLAEAKDIIRQEYTKVQKEGYVNVVGSITYETSDNLTDYESGKSDKLDLRVTSNMLMISERGLASAIAQKEEAEYSSEEVVIEGKNNLKIDIVYKEANQSNMLTNATSLELSIAGPVSLVYKTDTKKLKEDLAGRDNSDKTFTSILSSYNSVVEAKSKISPMWSSYYPKNKNKIKIEEKY